MSAPILAPEATACIELLGRLGAGQVQIRFSDDEQPVVWMAVASGRIPDEHGGGEYAEAEGALDPQTAILRLAERLVDGGFCVHCQRPTAFDAQWSAPRIATEAICWYVYDPELETYRRSCE